MSKTAAFKALGVKSRNPRWSWSGRSLDGKSVVLTFWQDRFVDFKARPILYDDTGWDTSEQSINRPGNRERMENIRWALEHLGGEVGVVIARAKDIRGEPREIASCAPQMKLRMRITHFDERTGEWRAESVGI